MKNPDRRIRRTHQALANALTHLMYNKAYDAITVQDILDQADVGRSTFYSHFYDKDDLLTSSLNAVFSQMYQSTNQLLPCHEFLQHIEQHQALYLNLVQSQRFSAILQSIQQTLINDINQRLGQNSSLQDAMIAPFLAGSFISIVRWWLEQKTPYSANQIATALTALIGKIEQ